MNENEQPKMQIAKRALDFISVGDCLLLDSSTTCWFLARQLPDIELTVLTNSLRTIQALAVKAIFAPFVLVANIPTATKIFMAWWRNYR